MRARGANQIFRPVSMFDYGIDGEIEFKDRSGKATGRKVYVQLKSGGSYLRDRKRDGAEVFDVAKPRFLEYWVNQPADVWLVIRDGDGAIRWMNATEYLKTRPKAEKDKLQIVFTGEPLTEMAVRRLRDRMLKAR